MKRAYEVMVIVDGEAQEGAPEAVIKQSTAVVEAEGGSVAQCNNWGRRRFAYEINHKWEGTYLVFEIVTDASNLDELGRTLRIADDVVRHEIIRLPEREAIKRGLFKEA